MKIDPSFPSSYSARPDQRYQRSPAHVWQPLFLPPFVGQLLTPPVVHQESEPLHETFIILKKLTRRTQLMPITRAADTCSRSRCCRAASRSCCILISSACRFSSSAFLCCSAASSASRCCRSRSLWRCSCSLLWNEDHRPSPELLLQWLPFVVPLPKSPHASVVSGRS